MAKILKNIFIAGVDEIVQDYTVESWHVSQSVDAFTGASDYDITISGSLTVVGPTVGSFTGSLQGTSSWANNAITASYVLQAVSSSYASSSISASYALNATTASYVLNAVSSSFASTASFINPLNQSVILTGSLNTSGSVILRGLTTQSNSFLVTINNLTGQLSYTSSAAAIVATTPDPPFNSFQYNNAGAFAGTDRLTFDGTTLRATGSFTGSFVGNLTGNATNLSTTRSNWATNGTITAVVGQLAWRNYGNNHTIFDASNGLSPDGTSINNTNPGIEWVATYPTLMGWNGAGTYGVRVDSSRYAENIKNTGTVTLASPTEANAITITAPSTGINGGPVKLLNFQWYSDTWAISNVRGAGADSLGLGIFLNSTEVGRFTSTDFKMFSRDVIAFAASDKRLKDNITPISNPIEKIQKIGGYEFDWIPTEEAHSYEGHDIGVIAQEIEEVLPELVTTRDNGYKAVKYEKIVALLIEAIKDQQKQIDDLKSKIK